MDFRPLLIACLEESAAGRYGLFEQIEESVRAKYCDWPEANRLKEIAAEISALRNEFGQPNKLVQLFSRYCSLQGPNSPGEPKMAKLLLKEIHQLDA